MTYRGFSLIEVLVASVIGGVIMLGSVKALMFSLQAGGVAKAGLIENDFKLTISSALDQNCNGNLKPDKLDGTDKAKGLGTVEKLFLKDDTEHIISQAEMFKDNIEIIKMELKGKAGTSRRDFVVFYKKNNLGDLNTVSNQECSGGASGDLKGCFTEKCKLKYTLGDNPDTTETETDHFLGCKSLTCHPMIIQAGGGKLYPCDWGEVYNPGGKDSCGASDADCVLKCDPRDQKKSDLKGMVYGENSLCKPNSKWNETKKKCICINEDNNNKDSDEHNFVLSVDGRCVIQNMDLSIQQHGANPSTGGTCLSNNGYSADLTDASKPWLVYSHLLSGDLAKYCSKKFVGGFLCLSFSIRGRDGLGGGYGYVKRIYNRENGQVTCANLSLSNTKGDQTGNVNPFGDTNRVPAPPGWFWSLKQTQ